MVDALAVVDDNDSRTNEGCIAGRAKGKMRVRWWSSADHIWPRAIKELGSPLRLARSGEWKYTALNICILIHTNLSCDWLWFLGFLQSMPI